MSISTKKIFASVLTSLTLALAAGCGGASSNNQGTSFLAFGWSDLANIASPSPNLAALQVPLATDTAILETNGLGLEGSAYFVAMALQNRLTTQFIRVARVDCSYDIQGTGLFVPDESINVSAIIAPTEDAEAEEGANSTLVEESGNFKYVGFPIITTDILSYLNVNRNSLPELPFRITATCHAVGVTQAGDTLETNDITLPIFFHDPAECCTGATGETPGTSGGFQTGAENGGGVNFDDGTNTAAP